MQELPSPAEVSAALMASASVPPHAHAASAKWLLSTAASSTTCRRSPLLPVEEQGGKTLVILSRLYRAFPAVKGRTYIQPSEPVPIGQFDITNPAGIRRAYEMGLRDGEAFARRAGSHSL